MASSLDSEALREVMTHYFEAMRVELEAHGGTIEKFIGDAIMAVFGLPTVHEDDALRAVRAAHGMSVALGRLNEDLERLWGVQLAMRIGVHTGEVVAGDPSTGQRLVTGDPVNTAARLEQAAGAGEILIGEIDLPARPNGGRRRARRGPRPQGKGRTCASLAAAVGAGRGGNVRHPMPARWSAGKPSWLSCEVPSILPSATGCCGASRSSATRA